MVPDRSYMIRKSRSGSRKRRRISNETYEPSLERRKALFEDAWRPVQQGIDTIIRDATAHTLTKVQAYLEEDAVSERSTDRVAVGLLVSAHGSGLRDVLFDQVKAAVRRSESLAYASLRTSEVPNLKSLLKSLIKAATTQSSGGAQPPDINPNGASSLLNYDLQILHDWCKARAISGVVVAFPDGENLDAALLANALSLFRSWKDRLRFTLLLGVGTSVESICDRLPRMASRFMRCQVIDSIADDSILQSIYNLTNHDRQARLKIGPTMIDNLLRRQVDSISSIESFVQAIKYAYMCHFHGNCLSLFLQRDLPFEDFSPMHWEAVRNLPSFQRYVEDLLEKKRPLHARQLLESDEVLYNEVKDRLEVAHISLTWTLDAASLVHELLGIAGLPATPPLSTLSTKALTGDLAGSTQTRELLLHIKRTSPDVLSQMLTCVQDTLITMPPNDIDVSPDAFADVEEQLNDLLERHADDVKAPQAIITGSTVRLPVPRNAGVQKVSHARNRQQDIAYTQLVNTFCEILESYLDQSSRDYRDLFLHEVLLYDLKSPHADVFGPKTRFAIERALSAPHDYLGCSCCLSIKDELSPSQPATALLYQLYLESGPLINVQDLLSAFEAIVGDHHSERVKTALFQRALAELKAVGFVKHSRKRVDHIGKLAWHGL